MMLAESEARCGKSPHAVGTMNTRKQPTIITCIGAWRILNRRNHSRLSKRSIITGKIIMPGAAIEIRDATTCVMPKPAAKRDFPTTLPFSSSTSIPFFNSFCLMRGMLTPLIMEERWAGWSWNWWQLTISNCNSSEWRISLEEWIWSLLQVRLVTKRSNESSWCSWNIRNAQLCCSYRRVRVSVRVINQSVEALIYELPENDSWNGSKVKKIWESVQRTFLRSQNSLVELQHCASNRHASRNLKAHPPKHILQITRIGVESAFIKLFGINYLLLRCSFRFLLEPGNSWHESMKSIDTIGEDLKLYAPVLLNEFFGFV